jgi:hypothetical protein
VLPSRPASQAAKRFQTKDSGPNRFGLDLLEFRTPRRRHAASRIHNNLAALGITFKLTSPLLDVQPDLRRSAGICGELHQCSSLCIMFAEFGICRRVAPYGLKRPHSEAIGRPAP